MFEPRVQNPKLAIALMLGATIFIAASTLMAKTVSTDMFGAPLHPLQVSHGRFLFALIGIGSAALVTGLKIQKPDMKMHGLRTLFGWGGISLMFAAVAYIPLSDVTAIGFLNPVFAMMLAIPLLGEKVGPVRWGAAILAMIGAVILLRPTAESFQPAALLALGAAIVFGFEIIFMKRLSRQEGPFQILLINNIIGFTIATIAVLPVWVMPTLMQWGALVGVGLAMAMAQTCFVNAVARADASFVVPFSYATLIFATMYDAAIFDVFPDLVSYIGGGIIILGGVVLAWREAMVARKV